jgi:hypothetical protein
MYFSPPHQQFRLPLRDNLHRAADFIAFHSVYPDQFWRAIFAQQVYLCLPIAENVNVRGLVIVEENDGSQTLAAVNGNHVKYNLTRWVFQI